MMTERDEIILPWLRDDEILEHLAPRLVSDDDIIYFSEELKIFRKVREGWVETWVGSTQVDVDYRSFPLEISVNWFGERVGPHSKTLAFEGGCIYPDQIEGEEQVYIQKFVQLVANIELNPLGLMLKSGVYSCPKGGGLEFDVNFGLNGGEPHLIPMWSDGKSDNRCSLPWEMYVAVDEPIGSIPYFKSDGEVIKPGKYRTDLKNWSREPLEVSVLRLRNPWEYHLDEARFLHHVVEGRIRILEILTDLPRRY